MQRRRDRQGLARQTGVDQHQRQTEQTCVAGVVATHVDRSTECLHVFSFHRIDDGDSQAHAFRRSGQTHACCFAPLAKTQAQRKVKVRQLHLLRVLIFVDHGEGDPSVVLTG